MSEHFVHLRSNTRVIGTFKAGTHDGRLFQCLVIGHFETRHDLAGNPDPGFSNVLLRMSLEADDGSPITFEPRDKSMIIYPRTADTEQGLEPHRLELIEWLSEPIAELTP